MRKTIQDEDTGALGPGIVIRIASAAHQANQLSLSKKLPVRFCKLQEVRAERYRPPGRGITLPNPAASAAAACALPSMVTNGTVAMGGDVEMVVVVHSRQHAAQRR